MAPRSQPATGFKPPRRPRRNGGGRGGAGTRDRGGGPGEAPVAELKLAEAGPLGSPAAPPSARAVARPRAPPPGRAWRSDTTRTGGRRSRRGPWKPVFRSLRPPPRRGGTRRGQRGEGAHGGAVVPPTRPAQSPRLRGVKGGTVGWRLGLPVNDPSAGSPTETLLRLLLPLDSQV